MVQVNMLAALPTDVLSSLCQVMLKHYQEIRGKDNSDGLLTSTPQQGQVPAYQMLRSCCKFVMKVCDGLRTSIRFHAENQALVEPYLHKLPNLKAATIKFSPSTADVQSSLASVHRIHRRLTSLSLCCKAPSASTVSKTLKIDLGVMLWRKSLLHLKLTGITSMSSLREDYPTLSFLSTIPKLQTLVLDNTFPFMESRYIAGCKALMQLTLNNCSRDLGSVLDLSGITSLQHVCMDKYHVKRLNLSGLKLLQEVKCDGCRTVELDVGGCTALERLSCMHNEIKALDVVTCPRLVRLNCTNNRLSQLELFNCSQLRILRCSKNSILNLVLSSCNELQTVECNENLVSILDVKACKSLRSLYASSCMSLITLDLSGLGSLQRVALFDSNITSLDVSGCTALYNLALSQCPTLISLLVGGCSRLRNLSVKRCGLQDIDLRGCAQLLSLDCSWCPVKVLDLSPCVVLESLMCTRTKIKLLDASPVAHSLVHLECDACPLEVLCVTGCIKLVTLSFQQCEHLRELSFDGCDSLKHPPGDTSKRFRLEAFARLRI